MKPAIKDKLESWEPKILLSSFTLLVISFGLLVFNLNLYFKGCLCGLRGSQEAKVPQETKDTEPEGINLFKNVEGKHLAQAEQRAKAWSEDAQLVFFATIANQGETFPYKNYAFYSPLKDKEFNVTWTKDGGIFEEETSQVTDKTQLIPFPPTLTVFEALELALRDFQQLGSQEPISQFLGQLPGNQEYWNITLKVQVTPKEEKKYEYKVFFDKKVEKR